MDRFCLYTEGLHFTIKVDKYLVRIIKLVGSEGIKNGPNLYNWFELSGYSFSKLTKVRTLLLDNSKWKSLAVL